MDEVLYLKFKQNPDIRQLLMQTGDAKLIYEEPRDLFWGSDPDEGRGANEMGKALMRIRERLRAER